MTLRRRGDRAHQKRLRKHRGGQTGDVAQWTQRTEPDEGGRDREERGPPRAANRTIQGPEEREERWNQQHSGQDAPQRQPPGLGSLDAKGGDRARTDLRERNEDRIAGRVGLVKRDVEVPNPQGKIDPVEVVEGYRK